MRQPRAGRGSCPDTPLLCVVPIGVVAPGSCGAGVLTLGGGVVEAEGLGDDRGGGLEDEVAEGGDPCGAQGDPQARSWVEMVR